MENILNTGSIRQEWGPNEGLILKLNKDTIHILWTRNFAHALRNLWSLRPCKNKPFILLRNKVISGKTLWWVKNFLVLLKSWTSHNPKAWKQIHYIFVIQSQISIPINCTTLSSFLTKSGTSSWPQSSSLVTQNCYPGIHAMKHN